MGERDGSQESSYSSLTASRRSALAGLGGLGLALLGGVGGAGATENDDSEEIFVPYYQREVTRNYLRDEVDPSDYERLAPIVSRGNPDLDGTALVPSGQFPAEYPSAISVSGNLDLLFESDGVGPIKFAFSDLREEELITEAEFEVRPNDSAEDISNIFTIDGGETATAYSGTGDAVGAEPGQLRINLEIQGPLQQVDIDQLTRVSLMMASDAQEAFESVRFLGQIQLWSGIPRSVVEPQ